MKSFLKTASWQSVPNTLLHVFEGYSGLYQAAKSPEVEKEPRALLDIWSEKCSIRKTAAGGILRSVVSSLIDLQSQDTTSKAHGCWTGAVTCCDRELSEKIPYDRCAGGTVLERGFDGEAVCNEIENGVTDTDRIWWVQSEAILGFTHMLEKHPNRRSTARRQKRSGRASCVCWSIHGKTANGSGKWISTENL
ncbi:MAG: hypothetical protein ACLTXT_01935 [Ruminococcus callidus]